jgi:hypothetical protein
MVEGEDRCGVARVAAVTLRGAGLAGVTFIGTTALGESAAGGSVAGGAFRAFAPVHALRSGLALGLSEAGNDGVAIGKDGPIGATPAVGSCGAGLRDRVAGLSEFDSAVAGAGGFTTGKAEAFASGGVGVREVVSCRRFRSACDVWSAAGNDFWVS